jgi:hypothetical protein
VQRFIILQNIEHFRRLLGMVTDSQERQAIAHLLAKEIEKLPAEEREWLDLHGPPQAPGSDDDGRSWP